MKLRLVVAAVAALIVAPAALAGYPSSMASTGDSITRAFNTGWLPLVDWPSNSWSTGSSTTVNSHYRRILAANPAIWGRNHNNAATGADMDELNAQVAQAVSQRVEYVTILMGANDVCAATEAAMTPVTTFRAEFHTALQTLSSGLPDARIYVVSIPDVYRLWQVYKDSLSARLVWSAAGICQSMLANAGSTSTADQARRVRVQQRNAAYNAELRAVCGLFIHCRFDQNLIFTTDFLRSDVSTRDYFHPSVAGQAKLAALSWSRTFNFADSTAPTTTATAGGGTVTLTASDESGVSGIEYRLNGGPWMRYAGPIPLGAGSTLVYRAVDVNGNNEPARTLTG